MKDMLLNLLFPPRCTWCDTVLGFVTECNECPQKVDALRLSQGSAIPKKGYQLLFVEEAYAPFYYKDIVRNAILRTKKFSDQQAVICFAKEIAACISQTEVQFDAIVPVPCRKNGSELSLLLANELGKMLSLPVYQDCLFKKRETTPQKQLTGKERRSNLLGAFAVKNKTVLKDKAILLVDDVLTTGSTLNECSKTLLTNDAKECYASCIACVKRGEE